jgi:hypothetical protein
MPVNCRVGLQGNPNGRVIGSIASLAASGTALVSFDLGETWDAYTLVQITVDPTAPETALNTVTVYGGDLAQDLVAARILGQMGTSGLSQAKFTNIAPATGAQSFFVRPMGRFVTVQFQNQDATNALGNTAAINFAAYQGA